MNQQAVQELMRDWEGHVAAAWANDVRAAHAAVETLARLEELGAPREWLDEAKYRAGLEARHFQQQVRTEDTE